MQIFQKITAQPGNVDFQTVFVLVERLSEGKKNPKKQMALALGSEQSFMERSSV